MLGLNSRLWKRTNKEALGYVRKNSDAWSSFYNIEKSVTHRAVQWLVSDFSFVKQCAIKFSSFIIFSVSNVWNPKHVFGYWWVILVNVYCDGRKLYLNILSNYVLNVIFLFFPFLLPLWHQGIRGIMFVYHGRKSF